MNKRIKYLITAICVVSLFGAAAYYKPYYDVQEIVKGSLIDPDSAKFKDIHLNRESNVACGWVNSKNKMGGYAGDQFFFVSDLGIVKFDETTVDEKLKRMDANERFSDPLMEECYR